MKQYNRVCARINLDAIAYNMEQMKNRIGQEGRLIAVIKTDAYGHGAVPLAEMFEETPYIWGYAVACMGEARTLRAHGIKKPILILGCVFPDEYEEMVEKEIRAAVYTEEMAKGMAEAAVRSGKTAFLHIKIDTGTGINQPYQLCKGCGKRNFHQLRWNFRRAKEDADRYDSRRIR